MNFLIVNRVYETIDTILSDVLIILYTGFEGLEIFTIGSGVLDNLHTSFLYLCVVDKSFRVITGS